MGTPELRCRVCKKRIEYSTGLIQDPPFVRTVLLIGWGSSHTPVGFVEPMTDVAICVECIREEWHL